MKNLLITLSLFFLLCSPAGADTTNFTASADTYLSSAATTTNYGTLDNFRVDGNAINNGLMQFDLTSLAGATLTSAKINLYCGARGGAADITIYKLLRNDWVETEADWEDYKGTTDWTTAGALGDGTDYSSTGGVVFANVNDNYVTNIDVTALVTIGDLNSFLFWTADADLTPIYSRTHATEAKRPFMTVVYTAAGASDRRVMVIDE